jgi:hypothetical protein
MFGVFAVCAMQAAPRQPASMHAGSVRRTIPTLDNSSVRSRYRGWQLKAEVPAADANRLADAF